MVYLWRIMPLSLCLFLNGCGNSRDIPNVPSNRPIDPDTGEPIVNAMTIAADWFQYAGITGILIGVLLILFTKMNRIGGCSIIAGVIFLFTSVVLNWIAVHLGWFLLTIGAVTVLSCVLYYKAVTAGLPWLEKLFRYDFNRDGNIGTGTYDNNGPNCDTESALEQPES